MADSEAVSKKLPGVTFKVVKYSTEQTTMGHLNGRVTLLAQVQDSAQWDAAIDKLQGFRLFTTSTEETLSAFSMELDAAHEELQVRRLRETELVNELAQKNTELQQLRAALAAIGHDLGIEA